MIIRVYRCTVVAGKDAEFREFAFSKVIRGYASGRA